MSELQDTEITLGTGRLLGLFFGLVIVCAIFFGLGFSMGRSSIKSTLTMEEAPTASQPMAGNSGQKLGAGTPDRAVPTSESSSEAKGAAEQNGSEPSTSTAPEIGKGAPLSASSGGNGSYAVQVAAVSKQEDADALVSALKRKSYPVFIANASDKLIHV